MSLIGQVCYRKEELTNAVRAKQERKADEKKAALEGLTEEERKRFNDIEKIQPGDYQTCISQALAPIPRKVDQTTAQDLREVIALGVKRDNVEQTILDRLDQIGKSSLKPKVWISLDWLCGMADERTSMMAWVDELALGRQTVDRFIKELGDPTMSHSPDECEGGCGSTPALACDEVRFLARMLRASHLDLECNAAAVDAALGLDARDIKRWLQWTWLWWVWRLSRLRQLRPLWLR